VSVLYVYMDAGTPNVYLTRENFRTGNDDIVASVFIVGVSVAISGVTHKEAARIPVIGEGGGTQRCRS